MTWNGFFIIRKCRYRRPSKEGRSIVEHLRSKVESNALSRFEDQVVSPSKGIVGEVAMKGGAEFVQELGRWGGLARHLIVGEQENDNKEEDVRIDRSGRYLETESEREDDRATTVVRRRG